MLGAVVVDTVGAVTASGGLLYFPYKGCRDKACTVSRHAEPAVEHTCIHCSLLTVARVPGIPLHNRAEGCGKCGKHRNIPYIKNIQLTFREVLMMFLEEL